MSDNATAERIVGGALRAVVRRGSRKLSVSDICDEAGVARGTFYRYFTSRDEVLQEIGQHFSAGVASALDAAIVADPVPEHRLRVVIEAIMDNCRANPETVQLMEVEPAFALRYLRESFPTLIGVVAEALAPAIEQTPASVNGTHTREQLAELFLRVVVSTLMVPGSTGSEIPAVIESVWSPRTGPTLAASPARKRIRPAS
jgi:AcrR family transcriptional regulator